MKTFYFAVCPKVSIHTCKITNAWLYKILLDWKWMVCIVGICIFCFYQRDRKEEIKFQSLMQWIKSLFIIWTTYFGAADWQAFTFPFLKYMNKMSEPQRLLCECHSLGHVLLFLNQTDQRTVHYPKEYMWHINFPQTTSEHNWKPIRKNSTVFILYYKCIITL